MLKKIPKKLSPDLVHVLMSMGHGDEIVFADANFPSASHAERLIRCDGLGMVDLLEDICTLFPLDHASDYSVYFMDVEDPKDEKPEIWDDYEKILKKDSSYSLKLLTREEFYKQSREAFAIVATGEEALYANVILKKGVV